MHAMNVGYPSDELTYVNRKIKWKKSGRTIIEYLMDSSILISLWNRRYTDAMSHISAQQSYGFSH